MVTLSVWALFRLIFTFEEHGGYDFPWNLNKAFPFVVCADHHNFHHEKNIGNYSEFSYFWDRVFGTDQAYIDFKKEERNVRSSSPSKNDLKNK
jgi:sterol desaturase/sphingolipid hydroxylase (fatty acid hydroxylase superfamily)